MKPGPLTIDRNNDTIYFIRGPLQVTLTCYSNYPNVLPQKTNADTEIVEASLPITGFPKAIHQTLEF